MRQSRLFTQTRKEAPADEVATNAKLLIRSGYIHKEIAGVYSFLPLGLRVLSNISTIIREEMNALGAEEIFLTALQDPDVWSKTGRWNEKSLDVWFKTKLKSGTDIGLAATHEEPLVRLMTHHINSHQDLPQYVYQIQTKFRNELRAKSGLFRGREFLMKDLYSFNKTQEEFKGFYEECARAYKRIFKRVGIGLKTFRTFASGGSFSEYSDEFQMLSEAGEDTIYLNEEKGVAVNKEVYTPETLKELGLSEKELVEKKAIEVGNIFPLGTKFSEPLGLTYRDEDGSEHPVVMGSYGIGLGRLMGAVVEMYHDESGIIWPVAIAPFQVHLLIIGSKEGKGVHTEAEKLYAHLTDANISVLYDDRQESAGTKLSDADLLGIPLRVVVSKKTVEHGKVEVKNRNSDTARLFTHTELMDRLTA